MNKTLQEAPSEMEILRRIVDGGRPLFPVEAARAILRLEFSKADRERMNELADRNRKGKVTAPEEQELGNYIRVGQFLGILQSKARRSLQRAKVPSAKKRRRQ